MMLPPAVTAAAATVVSIINRWPLTLTYPSISTKKGNLTHKGFAQ